MAATAFAVTRKRGVRKLREASIAAGPAPPVNVNPRSRWSSRPPHASGNGGAARLRCVLDACLGPQARHDNPALGVPAYSLEGSSMSVVSDPVGTIHIEEIADSNSASCIHGSGPALALCMRQ
jgi:hypothetical protein